MLIAFWLYPRLTVPLYNNLDIQSNLRSGVNFFVKAKTTKALTHVHYQS